MKKIISIWLGISLLCACSSMQGLRINNPNLPKGKQYIGEGIYYNDNTKAGHNIDVKHAVTGENTAQITIPVNYKISQNMEIPTHLPEVTEKALENWDLKGVGECGDTENKTYTLVEGIGSKKHWTRICTLTSDMLMLKLRYYRRDGEYAQLPPFPKEFSIENYWENFNAQDLGITVDYKAEPNYLKLDCSSRDCVIVNQAGNIVNEITITKQITVNPKRINELLAKEKKDAEERAKAEAKRKAEEAKKKAEEDRKWRQKQRLQKKECPGLYRTLYWAQQTGYIDPIVGMKTAKRFEELDCQWWLQDQMNQAMY